MPTTPLDMTQTQSKMHAQGVELQQRTIGNLSGSTLSDAEKSEKLREACEGFESIFIQKMWQQMRATVPQENPLVGREEKFWQSMYDQELSKKMASSGGIGLADMMYEQLSRNLVSASNTTASSVSRTTGTHSGFDIEAVPLMPPQHIPPMAITSQHSPERAQANLDTAAQPHGMASIYDGAAPLAGEGAYTTPAPHGVNGTAGGTAGDPYGNTYENPYGATPVQQFMHGLQQKQAAQAGMNAYANGVAQAQNVEFQVNSQAPGAVLPHVVRTTYTTNIPQNAARRGEEAHRDVVQNLNATQNAQQIAAVNTLNTPQAAALTAPATPPVLTASTAQQAMPQLIPPTTQPVTQQTMQPVTQQAIQPVTQQAIQPVTQQAIQPVTPQQATQPITQTTPPSASQAGDMQTPTAGNVIRPILPAGAVVAPSAPAGSVSMAPYDPVRPYTPTGTRRKVEDSSGA